MYMLMYIYIYKPLCFYIMYLDIICKLYVYIYIYIYILTKTCCCNGMPLNICVYIMIIYICE